MPFSYFIPSSNTEITPADIDRLGLGYAIDQPRNAGCTGPEHQRGFVMGANHDHPVAMNLEKQTWVPAPKRGADKPPFYVGWEAMPTPEDLARGEQVDGEALTLTNGLRFKVPKFILWHENSVPEPPAVWSHNLPVTIGIDDDGNPTQDGVVEKYSDLFDFGMKVMTKIAGGVSDVTEADLIRFAANCLSVNYRVSLLELSARVMNCLTPEDAIRIIEVAVDRAAYEDAVGNWDGRQGRPTTDTPSGSDAPTPDSQPTTDPQLAS